MALFFHDLQKQNERDDNSEPHPILGALSMVPRSLAQFGVSQDFISKVQWLVWHHQELAARTGNSQQGVYYSDLIDLVEMGKQCLG